MHLWLLVGLAWLFCGATPLLAAEALPDYLRDRGTGMAVSMFGTYVRPGELLVYPFFEYYVDDNFEYSPDELDYDQDKDYRGVFRQSEFLLFLGYGFSDSWAGEFEAAYYTEAELLTADDDVSGVPNSIQESGLGDVESRLNWRWLTESAVRPEIFNFLEVVFPLQKDKVLIGTQDWEVKLGICFTKGFSWGTTTLRMAAEHDAGENVTEAGEYALEYLKRLSDAWRIYTGIEGDQDEVVWIIEGQWHFRQDMFFKVNNGFGLTTKATDVAPEIGLMMVF